MSCTTSAPYVSEKSSAFCIVSYAMVRRQPAMVTLTTLSARFHTSSCKGQLMPIQNNTADSDLRR